MKIEAGCKAVIVNSIAGNDGVVVGVVAWIGVVDTITTRLGDIWEIDTELPNGNGRKVTHAAEQQLKRIDDDSRQVVSWEELANIWIPKIVEPVEDRL